MFICVSKIIVFTHFLPQQFVFLGSKVLKNSNYGKGKKGWKGAVYSGEICIKTWGAESSGETAKTLISFVRERGFWFYLQTTMMHHSTDDSEPDGAMPVQQRDDSASSSDSASAVSNHTITITVYHGSSDHHLHVPQHATFGIKKNTHSVLCSDSFLSMFQKQLCKNHLSNRKLIHYTT